MPTCKHCGAFVTEAYVRVFAPDGETRPRACPFCEDVVRDGGRIRPARGPKTRWKG